jgi:hypothetical protein
MLIKIQKKRFNMLTRMNSNGIPSISKIDILVMVIPSIKEFKNLEKNTAVLAVAILDHKHLSWCSAGPMTRGHLQRGDQEVR